MSDAQPPLPTDALEILAAAAAAVARSADLDTGLTTLLELALPALAADRGAILVQDPDAAELEVAAASGHPDGSLAAIAASAGGPEVLTDAASGPAGHLDAESGDGRRISLLPLIAGHDGVDRPVGMLVLERAGAPIGATGERLLRAIADLAAIAVDRAQIRSVAVERAEWFERLAASDPLTGLANRHVLGRALEHEITRAGRQSSEVSVAIFDVDAFRAVNDGLGREAGNRVLQEVAAAIGGSVRMIDTVGRLGGDEFVVVAPGSGGMIVARRVMDAINRLTAVLQRTVSVSAGVARFPTHGASADELLEAATGAVRTAQVSAPGALVEATVAASA